MADLQVLFAEVAAGGPFDLADHIRRSPAVGFVDGQDDPFRVILDASGKPGIPGKENFVRY